MAKPSKSLFVCQACGTTAPRWVGKCPGCEAWNTLVEEASPAAAAPGTGLAKASKGRVVTLESLKGGAAETPRLCSGIEELDRVTGGGLVPGSALLIGGEPGIGKSTLLLQLSAAIAQRGGRALYFSGEEAVAQVRLRAERLGLADAPVGLAAETNLASILATLEEAGRTDLIVVDSIQTLWTDGLDAAPGTVSQVRGATQALIRHAKARGTALLLVGHVTKDGAIAGPKVIEHMVDTVLYFEGERGHTFRILRAVKNRFGPTDEIGVFEMAHGGLREVRNPSELFLGNRDATVAGASVFAGMEGTRPVLVEIQALVAASGLGTPRRAVIGWDSNRLSMLLAVLDTRCGISLAQCDVFLNVAGGLKIADPAADLAAAAALLSSFSNVPLPADTVYFGEISLSGAIRPAAHSAARIKEAAKLGFAAAVLPAHGEADVATAGFAVLRTGHVKALAEMIGPCQ
ncbi:MAG: DNA repair protein RadA [Hyphomicrobiaceae bacterium]|nr:DNA repair protein RadA [Hyphomicrobiaceae bacterium]